MPVVTRWGTWIEAAIYYADNYDNIVTIVNSFDPKDAASIKVAQLVVTQPSIKTDLPYIKANFSCIPIAQTQLQTSGAPLTDAIQKFEAVGASLRGICMQEFSDTFNYVATKNTGLSLLKKIVHAINPGTVGPAECDDANMQFIRSLSTVELACYKFAPVERTFSMYKNVLHEKRRSFTFENLKKHVIANCNNFN